MKYILVFLFCIALAAPSAFAAPFSTAFSAIDNEILPNETAVFELQISNFGSTQGRYQVYSIDPTWIVDINPASVRVDGGSSQTFTLTLKPKSTVPFGSQGITVNVKDLESGDLVRKNLFVAVQRYGEASGTFQISVAFDAVMPTPVDPRNPVPLTVFLRNRNQLDIDGMTLTLTSPHFSYTKQLDLEPLSENTEYLSLDIDSGAEPGDYLLTGKLTYRNAVATQIQKGYTIGSFATVTQEQETNAFLFKTVNIFTLTNDGNTAEEATVTIAANQLERLFSSVNPDATYDDGRYIWHVTVPAGETMVVTHRENYQYFIIFLILAIIGTLLYFQNRSPILCTKEAVGKIKDEGMSDVKVRLFIKNRSSNVIQSVEVFDKVPSIVDLEKTHEVGTLKPTKVSKLKSGTLLQWKLDVLEPYEERIVTYSIKSKLKIIGRMRMPEAKVKFETTKGQERIIFSSNLLVVEK